MSKARVHGHFNQRQVCRGQRRAVLGRVLGSRAENPITELVSGVAGILAQALQSQVQTFFFHRNSLSSEALQFHFKLQLPMGAGVWSWALPTTPAASTLGTPRLESVIPRDILSSLPHMAAPSAPSPGTGQEERCVPLPSAGNCRSQDSCLPSALLPFTPTVPGLFLFHPILPPVLTGSFGQ